MKQLLIAIVLFGAGLALGWWLGSDDQPADAPPDDWIARIDGIHIGEQEFIDEMRRRGGTRPGQYHDMEQKQRLLESLLYRKATARAAEEEGMHREPEIRRSLERILVNQYLSEHLRPRQEQVEVSDEEIAEIHERQADNYAVPARRRVAMIRIEVPDSADETYRAEARERAEEALAAARELDENIAHFGHIAREYSDDQSSRYRGGVIGWIGEEAPERYRHDPVVIETANGMTEAGAMSGVLEGNDGLYIVRLVEYQPARTRPLDELASGIRQGLLRDRYRAVEDEFRKEMLDRYDTEIRAERLEAIEPLGPPERDERRPPEGPTTGSRGN